MKRTIRVRIAVAVDAGGEWQANGWGGLEKPYEPDAMASSLDCLGNDSARYWIEVELPIPDSPPASENVVVIDCGTVASLAGEPIPPG